MLKNGSGSPKGIAVRFDPSTKALFTDSGELVKILRCPLQMRWEQLSVNTGSPHRVCSECAHSVLDTAEMSDAEVLAAVQMDLTTCLRVRASQANVTLLRAEHGNAEVDRAM